DFGQRLDDGLREEPRPMAAGAGFLGAAGGSQGRGDVQRAAQRLREGPAVGFCSLAAVADASLRPPLQRGVLRSADQRAREGLGGGAALRAAAAGPGPAAQPRDLRRAAGRLRLRPVAPRGACRGGSGGGGRRTGRGGDECGAHSLQREPRHGQGAAPGAGHGPREGA
ncbi:unnamed protein product, partial [Effrenium voratum]